MPRNLTAQVKAEVLKNEVRLLHFVEFHFDPASVYFTDAPIAFDYNSNTYLPTGDFLSFSEIRERDNLDAGNISITLSGVNTTNIGQALSGGYLDRKVIITRAFVDSTYTIIPDPSVIFDGNIISFEVREDINAGTSILTWKAASMWSDFERTAGRRTNDNDQQVYYPGDRGFQFADDALKDIKWGRP